MVDFVRRLLQVNGAKAHVLANVCANVCEVLDCRFDAFSELYYEFVCKVKGFLCLVCIRKFFECEYIGNSAL